MADPVAVLLPVLGPGVSLRQTLTAAVGALLVAGPAFAAAPPDQQDDAPGLQGKGFTLYAGYQFGGSFTDETSGNTVNLREGGSYAASLDVPLDQSSEFQVFYGHQATEFTPWPYPTTSSRLRLDYLHIGGTYFPDELGHGVYAVGGLGVTRMTPDAAGLDPATKLSLNIGVGYLLPFSRNFGVRFEARGLATMLGSNTAVFCSGGCVVHLTGSGVLQGELLVGLSARFN